MTQLMTQPWESIREFYMARQKGIGPLVEPMIDLVTAIEKSKYTDGLHAWTSMLDLCIVQTPVSYPYGGPFLKVSPKPSGKLEFRYFDTTKADKQWHRLVDSSDGFRQLDSFIVQRRWFNNVP